MTFPTQEHIEAAQAAADSVYVETGFYCWPSVTLAQALVESARWTALSGANNGFGVKATPAQVKAGNYKLCPTREVINGRSVRVMAPFANFPSLAAAYVDHARLFVRVKLYAHALKATNPRQFVVEIAHHYASAEDDPDPKKRYSPIIIGEMDSLNLYRYDNPAHGGGAHTQPVKPSAHDTGKATAPAAAGAVVVAGGAIAAAAQHGNHAALIAALGLAMAAGAFAAWRLWQAHASIAAIPPLPLPPAPPPAPASPASPK